MISHSKHSMKRRGDRVGSIQVRRKLHDYPTTWDVGDEKAGHRLDRRKNYMIIDGQICEVISYTSYCTGCLESGDYGGNLHHYKYDHKAGCHIGAGCTECGYQGKVRRSYWHPIPKRTQKNHESPK